MKLRQGKEKPKAKSFTPEGKHKLQLTFRNEELFHFDKSRARFESYYNPENPTAHA